jgi:hypothetical protein
MEDILFENNESQKLIFYIDIFDGYSFRQVMEFFANTISSIPIEINKNFFKIKRGNINNTIIVDAIFLKNKLLKYYINEEFFNNKSENKHIITPNLNSFIQQIKTIPKQGSVRIFQYSENPNNIFIQQYGGNKSNYGYTCIKLDDYVYKEYNINDNITELDNPNAKISILSFSSACESSIKFNCANFMCFKNYIIYNVNSESTTDYGKIKWSSDDFILDESREFFTIKINNSSIKTLSKIKNINLKGILNLYCKCDNIFKIYLDIGLMGNLKIYIIDEKKY